MTAQEPMILYFWPTQNGFKIAIMLEELGVPYTLRMIDVDGEGKNDPQFQADSPSGKLPVLIDPDGPDGEPIRIFESAAILFYLGRKYGRLVGSNERERSEIEQWTIWQVANLGPGLGQVHHYTMFAPEKIPYAIDRHLKIAATLYAVIERRLEGREFVAGDFSVADIAIFPWTRPWRLHGVTRGQYPNWERWFARMNELPCVQRGLTAGGEITAALEAKRKARFVEMDRLAALASG